MKVGSVQNNNQRQSAFVPMVQGAATGAIAGYVAKYALPVTPEEKLSDEYIKVSNKIHAQKNEYNFRTEKFVASLRSKADRSLADDEFIKVFDGLKEGDRVRKANIRNAIKNLADNKEELVKFKRLCKKSSEVAERTAKQCMNAYDLITKHIRPTGFFLTAGAIIGAGIALAYDIMKTDVKDSAKRA